MDGNAAAICWTKIGDNHFSGQGPSASETGLSSNVDIGVTYDTRLVDPQRIAIVHHRQKRLAGRHRRCGGWEIAA